MPIVNNSNYTYPITVAGPTTFKATATANSSAVAEANAREQVLNQATATYGVGTTQLVGVPEYYVKLNDNKTYTATYTVQAEQITPEPPPTPPPATTPDVVATNPPVTTPTTVPISAPPTIEVDPNPAAVITPVPGPNPVTNVDITGQPPERPATNPGTSGLEAQKNDAIAQATGQDQINAKTQDDWRVRLSLAPGATYLYNAKPAGILEYLKNTNGVVFPYVPQIQVTYAANYETSDIVHTNYKMIQYKNSAVDQITITGDFTAQDTYEANYMLAVIHFFKAVTKMFYGQDQIPKPGTPPPLCYLSGLGDFQFDMHPLVVSSFNYSLPNDVDYIRASSPTLLAGVDSTAYNAKGGDQTTGDARRQILNVGATASPPNFTNKATNTQPTYVPTKMQITITAFPMVTRNDISNKFSVRDYATGALLQGRKRPGGAGGIW